MNTTEDRATASGSIRRLLETGRASGELRGVNLIGADLTGADLSGLDLSEADLSRADLSGAKLTRAKLVGAVLFGAKLDGCELFSADLKEADLTESSAERAGFGAANLEGALLFNANLTDATLTQARLCSADLRAAKLRGARLREADLTAANLSRADMRDSDLEKSCVERASFVDTDLRDARLRGVTGGTHANWIGADIVGVDFCGAYLVRRSIADQNYLHEFRSQNRWSAALYWAWWISSDCGRSFVRWGLWTVFIAAVFAGLFEFAEVDYGDHPTALSSIYYSVVTLTTLGYGDVLPASLGAQILAMTEVVIGYVMLGGLLSIFSNKMARRAD